jgi:hypothetical protein
MFSVPGAGGLNEGGLGGLAGGIAVDRVDNGKNVIPDGGKATVADVFIGLLVAKNN